MDMEEKYLLKEMFIQETFLKEKCKAKEFFSIMLNIPLIKESLKMINLMEMGCKLGLMEGNIKGSISMVKKMDKVFFHGLMGLGLREVLRME